jgi:hypothetical protein
MSLLHPHPVTEGSCLEFLHFTPCVCLLDTRAAARIQWDQGLGLALPLLGEQRLCSR